MNDPRSASAQYPFYPAKYFSASKTHFEWNPLTCADIHNSLQTRSGFEGQNLYFVLNHPIQYVRVVGVLVGIELIALGKYLLLTIDDGSGSTLDCKVAVRQPGNSEEEGGLQMSWPSNTLVDELGLDIAMGLASVKINNVVVDIGTILKVKGTIETFRNTRQLVLKRIQTVHDTNEEVASWRKTAGWKAEVLSKPWVLSEVDKGRVDEELRVQKERELRAEGKRRVKNREYEEKKRRHEARKEKRRRMLEGEMDRGALSRSAVLPGER